MRCAVIILLENILSGLRKACPHLHISGLGAGQNLVELSNNETAFIVDLRDSEQFQNGHITGSINIPFLNLSNRTNEIPQDKSVILVCEMGNVSPNAGELLKKEGIKELLILKGGINEWRIQNLPLV